MEPEEAGPDTATLREAQPWGSRVPDRSSQRYQKAGQKIFIVFVVVVVVFDEDPLKIGSSGCDSAPCFHARLSQSGCSGSLSPRPPQHRCTERTVKCLDLYMFSFSLSVFMLLYRLKVVDLICGFVLGFGFIKVGCVILGVAEWLRMFRKESVWEFCFFEGFQFV